MVDLPKVVALLPAVLVMREWVDPKVVDLGEAALPAGVWRCTW